MAVEGSQDVPEDAPWLMAYGQRDDDDSDTESILSCMSETSETGADPSSRVYIGRNLPASITPKHIEGHFKKYGFSDAIGSCRIFYDKGTRKSKGCGYITVSPPARAQDAIRIVNGTMLLDKHRLTVRPFKNRGKGQSRNVSRNPPTPGISPSKGKRGTKPTQGVGVVIPPSIPVQPGMTVSPPGGLLTSPPVQHLQNPPPFPPQLQMGPPQLQMAPPQLQMGPPQLSSSVVVENLSSQISKEELGAMLEAPFTECKFKSTGQGCKKATLRFANHLDASSAVAYLNGKQLLGLAVRAFQPPVSTQPAADRHPKTYGVKVTHIPPDTTKEMLQAHFEPVGKVVSCVIHRSSGQPPYAHVNFANEEGARNAVGHLHQSLFGQWIINVSLSKPSQVGKQPPSPDKPPNFPPPPHHEPVSPTHLPLATGRQFTVKVLDLPPGVSDGELRRVFGHCGNIHSTRVFPDVSPPYAYVNYLSEAEAQLAQASLHGSTPWPGCGRIRVLQPPSKLTKPRTTPSPLQQPTQTIPSPGVHKSPSAEERLMALQPTQWNQLMKVEHDGSSHFQQLSAPFKTNPNVRIEPQITEHSLRFVGSCDAVISAYKHFSDALNKELHIPDRVKMAALLNLFPQLATTLSQSHSVSIAGFQEGSSLIVFQGTSGSVESARAEFDRILCQLVITEHEFQHPPTLIPSLKKRIREDGIQVYVYSSPSTTPTCTPKMTACAFSPSDHARAVELITSCSPYQNYVIVPSKSCLSQIEKHPDNNLQNLERNFSVTIEVSKENKLYIRGFVLHDVQAVRKLLAATVKDVSVSKEPLLCTAEQAEYLQYVLFQHPTEETNAFLSSLPLQREHISCSGNRIMLQGSPEAVTETRERIMTGPLLAGLLHRSFKYNCHPNALTQIQQYVLDPFKESNPAFIYTCTMPQQKPKGKNPSGKREDRNISVTVFSKEQVEFTAICQLLEPLRPQSRRYSVRHQAVDIVKGVQVLVEKKYRVRLHLLVKGSAAIVIHGLTEDEIEQCWGEIEECIDSRLEIVKYIPVDACLAKYLQQKRGGDIDNWRSECREFVVPKGSEARRDGFGLSIIVKGTVKQVETIEEQIADIKSAFSKESFTVPCHPKLRRMWTKRWKQVKKEQEGSHDLLLEYSQFGQGRRVSTGDGEQQDTEVHFSIFGPDREGIESVKHVIMFEECDPRVLQKQIKLTDQSRRALLEELKRKQLDITALCVELDIDRDANTATIFAPESASDDLGIAEAKINQIVVDRTISTRQVTCPDLVVGLVLTSKSKSPQYLAVANSNAKPHNVSVRPLRRPRYGFLLTGSATALQVVEPIIRKSVIDQITKTIEHRQLKFDSIYAPVFNSAEFKRFDDKLQEDFCVVGSYPRSVKQSKVVKSVLLQPSSSAQCVRLEFSKGTLVHDQVDAIVNAANEDLQHIGGLAKAILDAGGPSIQQESDDYVRLHGKVSPGNAICLGPGNLQCKKVIHAVGPRWVDGRHGEEQSLYFTVYNTLSCASREKLGSIALPAISAGIFGVPEEVCARASIKAVRDFCQANPNCSIHTIRFCLFQQSTLDTFLVALQAGYLDGSIVEEPATLPPATTPPTLPAHVPSCMWMWQERDSFVPYASDISHSLTQEYSRNPSGVITIPIQGNMYVINFAIMTQTNLSTGYKRRIQLVKGTGSINETVPVQWYFTDDKGRLTPYKPDNSKAIEAMWQSGNPHQLHIAGNTYTFDFKRMCQVNVSTNYRRSIDRRETPSRATAPTGRSEPAATSSPPVTTQKADEAALPQKQLVVVLRGPKDTIQAAEVKLREKLKSLIKNNSITLPQRVSPAFEAKLKAIAKNNGVQLEVSLKSSGNKVTLRGAVSSVNHTTSVIQEEIIKHQISSGQSSDVEYPEEWQPGQQKTTQLYPVAPGSQEYIRVQGRFLQTMPHAQISQISRIQNIWLWEKYVRHRKMLHMKNAGAVNEKELFHGTRGNDPKNIYGGEEGFDMRFSRQGMWGRANYFAENSSYSSGYAYDAPDGKKVMFLVRVLTGDTYYCHSDSSLQMPPVKPSAAATAQVQFEQTRYDTVSGSTGGSKVYMTYDNLKAYPAYLIQYTG